MSVHPKAEGITRIRISFPRPVDGTGAILAVYGDGTEGQVGTVVRTVKWKPSGVRRHMSAAAFREMAKVRGIVKGDGR